MLKKISVSLLVCLSMITGNLLGLSLVKAQMPPPNINCPVMPYSMDFNWNPKTNVLSGRFDGWCTGMGYLCKFLMVEMLLYSEEEEGPYERVDLHCDLHSHPCGWEGNDLTFSFVRNQPGFYRWGVAIYNGTSCDNPGYIIFMDYMEFYIH